MANITKPRDAKRHDPMDELSDPVAAGVKLIKGGMYGLNTAGNAVKMESGVTAIARGEVLYTVDNTNGSAGDVKVRGRSGCFELHALGGDEPSAATDIGQPVYAMDDQTVGRTSNSGARPTMGKLVKVTPAGNPVVAVGVEFLNDSDADVDNDVVIRFDNFSSKAADAAVRRFVCPVAMRVRKIETVLNDALGAADATVQAKKNGSNVGSTTTGLVTITQSSSAADDVDSATPLTTNLTFAVGDVFSLTVGGGSTATGTLSASVHFELI